MTKRTENPISEKASLAVPEKKNKSKKKKILIFLFFLLLLLAISLFLFHRCANSALFPAVPAVTIESPDKKNAGDSDIFPLELRLTTLGEETYPAASFSISFDRSKLEFTGISEGNITVSDPDVLSGVSLPEWNVNTERANQTGVINIMYLDMTGGKYAFSKELLREKENVLLLLRFRLRSSVRPGDILELSLDDAVFAAADEEKSLASAKETLKTGNGRIVIRD